MRIAKLSIIFCSFSISGHFAAAGSDNGSFSSADDPTMAIVRCHGVEYDPRSIETFRVRDQNTEREIFQASDFKCPELFGVVAEVVPEGFTVSLKKTAELKTIRGIGYGVYDVVATQSELARIAHSRQAKYFMLRHGSDFYGAFGKGQLLDVAGKKAIKPLILEGAHTFAYVLPVYAASPLLVRHPLFPKGTGMDSFTLESGAEISRSDAHATLPPADSGQFVELKIKHQNTESVIGELPLADIPLAEIPLGGGGH